MVRSFAVGFSSISVFFPVQQTGPANTTDNECAYGWSHQQPIDALSSVVPLLGPISCPVEESAAFITLRGLQWRQHHASQEYPRFYLQSQKRRTGGAHTKGSKGGILWLKTLSSAWPKDQHAHIKANERRLFHKLKELSLPTFDESVPSVHFLLDDTGTKRWPRYHTVWTKSLLHLWIQYHRR